MTTLMKARIIACKVYNESVTCVEKYLPNSLATLSP